MVVSSELTKLEAIKRRCAGCKYFSYSKIGLMEFYHCLAYSWPLRYVLAIVERDRKGKIVKVEVSDWPDACVR